MTIIDPELNEAFIRSLIQKSREGGVLPMWELAHLQPPKLSTPTDACRNIMGY